MTARLGSTCPSCGAFAAPSARFCSECGTALSPHDGADAARPSSRRTATVLFADIKGSTQAISGADAESALVRIRPLINSMADAVRAEGGTIIELRGDGILAGFGALDSLEDHALAACRAALAIREKTKSGVPLRLPVRIGLHTGEVVVSVGLDGTPALLGATVHLASRLEQAAEPDTILLSDDVHAAITDAADVQPRGKLVFKGFDRPIETWELIDVEHRSRWKTRTSRGLTPYFSRTAERALLMSFIDRTKQGAGGVLRITGDAGTGKSRFIHEVLTSADLNTCTTWSVECELPARHSPYAIARSLLRQWLGLSDHTTQLDVERRLTAILPQLSQSSLDHAPALKALLNLSVGDTEWPTLDPIERKKRVVLAFAAICSLQTRYRPLFIVVDDAQWCDPETLQILSAYAETASHAAAGLVVLARTQDDQGLPQLFPEARAITLSEFSGKETQAFLTLLLGSDPTLNDLKARLGQLTGGLPFFLEEAVRYLDRSYVLVGEAGDYTIKDATAEITIPDTVDALVSSRISSLPAELWSVLSAASVVGRSAPLPLIAKVCDRTVANLEPKLHALADQHILAVVETRHETVIEFRHEFFRQVAYGMTLNSAKAALHAKTLRAAETLYDNRIADWTGFLAHHAGCAKLHPEAVRYCRIAAEQAVGSSSYRSAAEYCERAIHHLEQLPQTVENVRDSIDIRLLLRVATGGTSDFQSWLHHLNKAIELAESIGDMPRRLLASIHRTWALNFSSSAAEAARAGEAAVGLAQALRIPTSEVLARFALGQAYYAGGDYKQAITTFEPAIAWLRQGHETEQLGTTGTTLVLCLMMRANAFAALGQFGDADRELSHLEDLTKRTTRHYDDIALSYCRGMVWGGQGRLEPAVAALEDGFEACRKHGVNLFLPLISATLAMLLVATQRNDRAREVATTGSEIAATVGHNVANSAAKAAAAAVCLTGGAHREAIRLASEARSAAKAFGHRGVEVTATRVLAQAFMAAQPNEPDRSLFLLHEAMELAESFDAVPLAVSCGQVRIGLLSKSNRLHDAIRLCEHLLELTQGRDMSGHAARLSALLGQLRERAGTTGA